MASGRVSLRAVGGAYEVRFVDLQYSRVNVARTFRLEAVYEGACTAPVLVASQPWLTVSVDGDPAQPVGTTHATGAAIGSGVAAERKTLDFTLTIPAGTAIRSEQIDLEIHYGT